MGTARPYLNPYGDEDLPPSLKSSSVRRVREYAFVSFRGRIPRRLRWAFRKVGPLYQVRGVGKYGDLVIEPRWGWESVYRMLDGAFATEEGPGGMEGVEARLREKLLRLVEEYGRERIGYRERFNPYGRGKLLPHRYDPLKPAELPALGDEMDKPREILWLNYLLHVLGYGVVEYEVPPEGAFRLKLYEEPGEEVWKLAYTIWSGMFGVGDRGFLLNTPYLFEEYVGREFGASRPKPLEGGIRPDFLVDGKVPLDAKYKPHPTRSDIYQAFTYAVLLGSDRAILAYPFTDREEIKLGSVTISILPVLK